MKPIFSMLLSLLLLCGIVACGREEPISELEAIQRQLAEMEGYACSASLRRISEAGEKSYEIRQYYKATGEYRLELTAPEAVAGNYTIFDGTRICQYNPKLDSSIVREVPESQQRNELFLGQFLQNYMQSEGVGVEATALDEAKCVVLEAVLPQNADALATEKLWVDRESLLPVRFVLYDTEGEERYILDYHEFAFNPPFDTALFCIPE